MVTAGATPAVPDTALAPVKPVPPLAVQDVALVDPQARLDVPPAVIDAGVADSDTTGSTGPPPAPTVTVAFAVVDPPAPVQLSA